MFNGLQTYSVYVKQDAPEPLDTVIFVREGFYVWAMVFTVFWAAYHKLGHLALLLLAFYGALAALMMKGLVTPEMSDALQLGLCLWMGFDAPEWRAEGLRRRGYVLYDVVRGVDEEDATSRFIVGVA